MSKKSKQKKAASNQSTTSQQNDSRFLPVRNIIKAVTNKAIIFALLSLVFFIAFYYLKKSTPSIFGGEITNFGDVDLSYNSHQNEGISPLCGCAAEQEYKNWRGISFIARHIQLHNTAKRSPLTGYFITSPFPQEVEWTPFLKFKATLYIIALPYDKEFDPSMLISNRLPRTYIKQSIQLNSEKALYYFTEGYLNVSLLGQYPLGSWIPGKNSIVNIKNLRGMFPNSPSIATIEENYEEQKGKVEETATETLIKEYNDYPLGDFVGSNIVLWSTDKSYVMKTDSSTISPKPIGGLDRNIFNKQHNQIITAVLINPPFSIRVACISFASRHNQDVVGPSHIEDAFDNNVIPMYSDSGKLSLSIVDPVDQSADFDHIYQQIRENDTIVAKDVAFSEEITEPDHTTKNPVFSEMEFRLPPIPPKRGFNIFGQLSYFKLNSAQGKIMIGPYSQDIMAPSVVEFKNIKSMTTKDKVISVPLQIDTTNTAAKLHFQGVSDISINGESIHMNISKYRFAINYLMLFLALFRLLEVS